MFEGDFKLTFHLAPPLWTKRDPVTGEPRKRPFGPWTFTAFKLLAKLKGLRGTAFDIYGYTEDRKLERRLISDYEQLIEQLIAGLDQSNHHAAVELASLPEEIRGYGHVKERHVKHAKRREAELLEEFRSKNVPQPPRGEGVEHSVVIMAG
jgi:indolepyruvate ferredoxin oxidoreductase